MADASAEDVLDFWFGATEKSAAEPAQASRIARWYGRDDAFDTTIRERFGQAVGQARVGALDSWSEQPQGWLALLILLDQFPRNIYRDDPLAFAGDAHARHVAGAGLSRGDDYRLKRIERVFCYMPFEHSEALDDQERAVGLFTTLCEEMPPAERDDYETFLRYAIAHRDVIARFGRFPHRNRILGRTDTDAEAEYLRQPGSGF
jgi:uncharacterized protein (DUF924 family)